MGKRKPVEFGVYSFPSITLARQAIQAEASPKLFVLGEEFDGPMVRELCAHRHYGCAKLGMKPEKCRYVFDEMYPARITFRGILLRLGGRHCHGRKL